jgi:HEAT repeat protein
VRALAAAGEVPPGFDPSPLAADPLPQVRADAVPLLPRERLLPLAFDRSAAVRSAALARLDGEGAPRGLGSLRAFGPGGFWAVLSTPRGWRTWEYRVLAKAESEHIDGYVGAFLRQLHQKESSVNHLFGALGLGRSGDKQQLPELVALASHEDGSVRVAAAWSRVLLGDRAGHDLLRTMALGDDGGASPSGLVSAGVDPALPAEPGQHERNGDVAMMALDAVRALDCVESFTTLAAAAKSKVPAVRALAAAGLREQRARGEHEVDALLAELGKDPEELVRLAAAAR